MNDLLTFDFESRAVRIIQRDDAPWFIAADVAAILEYRNAPDMVRNLDPDEAATHIVRSSGQRREMSIISESGLFAAILKSRKPEARAFRRWVTGTVLPAIRHTGRFALDNLPAATITDPAWLNAAVAAVRESRRLFGPGIARAVWRDMGLPLPAEAQELLPDGMAQAIAVWAQDRDRFTNAEIADGIGLGSCDQLTARRFGTILPALGFERRRFRRRKAVLHGWVRVAQPIAGSVDHGA